MVKFVIWIADEDKKLNATYIISVARKLGCSIFLLPEDIIEVHLSMLNIILMIIMPIVYEKGCMDLIGCSLLPMNMLLYD